jgi:hypothetical protein
MVIFAVTLILNHININLIHLNVFIAEVFSVIYQELEFMGVSEFYYYFLYNDKLTILINLLFFTD